jgi:hypothetical protein
MSRAPPFKQRLVDVIDVALARGATRVKLHPDGSCEVDFTKPEAEATEPNDFDRPPNPPSTKRGNAST